MTHSNDPRDAQDVKDGLELFAEGLLRKFVEVVEIHRFDPQFPGPRAETLVRKVELRVLFYNTSRSPEVHLVLHNGIPYCLNRKGNFAALVEAGKHLLAELEDDANDYVAVYEELIIAERVQVAA